jgi:hypothetical protein
VNITSTKFIHAIGAQAVACIALFTGHLDGATWVAATTITLGIYSLADVVQKRNEQQ